MNEISRFLSFLSEHRAELLEQALEHVGLTFASLLIAIIIGLPLGVLITRKKKLSSLVLGLTGVLQTIPSIALLGFMIPLLGIGVKPAIFALFLYALLPIVRNTYTGIMGTANSIKEAAVGMGMSDFQLLVRIELPLALPVIFAGIRTATVINVGVATLAAYIAAGGLGEFIFGGIALNNTHMILAGAIPAALLAVFFDFLLAKAQYLKAGKIQKAGVVLLFVLPLMAAIYILPAAASANLKAGFSPEFIGRSDGYPGLKAKYNLHINNVIIAPTLVYKAVYENDVQVIDGYSTDGRIKAYDLIALVDDKSNFPPYYAAPIIRNATLEKHPVLEDVINMLAYQITDSAMTSMNYRVDFLKESPVSVATDFLKAIQLYRPGRAGQKGIIKIGSKIFSEQYILVEMYRMLIEGYTDLSVETVTGLGGTKICFDALRTGEIDMYPEYTGTGLQVILRTPGSTIKNLYGNSDKIYNYVDKAFNQQYNINWMQPLGFNNTYALLMTKTKASQLNIKTISDLAKKIDD